MNADSSVQLLAEEAVTLDMLDVGVSVSQESRTAEASVVLEVTGFGEGIPSLGWGWQAAGWGGPAWSSPTPHFLQAAKMNLEKAQSELSGAADEASRAEIQIRIEANEALVKALE